MDTSDTSDTSVYRHQSDTAPTRSDTSPTLKTAIQTVETRGSCLSSVNRVKLRHFDTSDTSDTACNARFTTQEPKNAHLYTTAKLGMQPMGLLGGSNPWPWPFGTTTPSTSAVGRHPDTSDTSDTQTLDTQTRSDTTHASQLSRALRHRLDTGQTPLTLLTPVSFDTAQTPAQTLLRHA